MSASCACEGLPSRHSGKRNNSNTFAKKRGELTGLRPAQERGGVEKSGKRIPLSTFIMYEEPSRGGVEEDKRNWDWWGGLKKEDNSIGTEAYSFRRGSLKTRRNRE